MFDTGAFTFVWLWMFALLPLPWLVRRILPAKSDVQQGGLYIPFADDIKQANSADRPQQTHAWKYLLLWLVWLLLIIAAARPQWVGEPVDVARSGRDLMLAIDLSGSMQEQDFELSGRRVDRLTATKVIASDFIKQREGDRIGLILFGSQAYLQAPLTFDRKTVNQFLSEAVIGLAGKKTAIGDAIGLAVKRLKDVKNTNDLVLILLTDGENTAGALKPEEAVVLAKEIGLRIHTVGIGASAMRVSSFFGSQVINPSADLDETMLKHIAESTGGRYFRAHDTQEMAQIYAVIDKLEPVKRDAEKFRPVRALFVYPLTVSFALLMLLLWWRARWT
ncbi:MAG: VWA domain-containing protein [Ghiorsea sp.]|nr:VWA domain-containing protein [Ghiorsea sp.]